MNDGEDEDVSVTGNATGLLFAKAIVLAVDYQVSRWEDRNQVAKGLVKIFSGQIQWKSSSGTRMCGRMAKEEIS